MSHIPKLVGQDTVKQLRKYYDDQCESLSDEGVLCTFGYARHRYEAPSLWDHVGDAERHYNALADEYRKLQENTRKAIELAVRYGGIGGDHHKAWVIDQMVRALAGNKYKAIVAKACRGEDGDDTYEWDCGVAP